MSVGVKKRQILGKRVVHLEIIRKILAVFRTEFSRRFTLRAFEAAGGPVRDHSRRRRRNFGTDIFRLLSFLRHRNSLVYGDLDFDYVRTLCPPPGLFEPISKLFGARLARIILRWVLVCRPVKKLRKSRWIFHSWQGARTPRTGLYARTSAAGDVKDQRIMKVFRETAH